jgi:putative membrane-bound dehydrogenase-like protein
LDPAASLAAMRARAGFTVDCVASEPLVEDPVAFEWDEHGRLWVAEMRDYPSGSKRRGAVRRLTDRDGDGFYDETVLFAEDLPYPTSVFPWKDGVLVGAAPDILFLRDTDGDGRADEREVWFTGARAHGFEVGDVVESPITGPAGNVEYLLLLRTLGGSRDSSPPT